jgi:RNA polymerase sigma-70 factor (ECF subfamily)
MVLELAISLTVDDAPGVRATAGGLSSLEAEQQLAERQLVERLRGGDSEALAPIYDRHHDAIRTFCRRLVGDHSVAEDLLQDVFVTLPRAILRFRGESPLASFLTAVAINHARHHVRAAARRRRAMERLTAEPPAPVGSPEHETAKRQLAAALLSALDELPLRQRVAFVLLVVEERTSVEAARLLGVPEATLRTRLFHARRRLRESLVARGYHERG